MEWERYKERLRAALEAMHAGDAATDPHRARALMEQRARALARPVLTDEQLDPDDSHHRTEVVSFRLGDSHFAIDAAYVRSIDRMVAITVLPGAPAPLVGVTNVRGAIVAVVELAAMLGVTRKQAPAARMLVLGADTCDLVALVDAVDEIRTISWRTIRPLADGGPMRAITDSGVVVLDAALLLADPRLIWS